MNVEAKTRFAQANIHHAKAASAVIARMFAKRNLGVGLIQEPWHYRGRVRGLHHKDIKVVYATGQDPPRACIMIRKDINHILLSEYLTRDLVAVKALMNIEGNQHEIVIASAYFPWDGNSIPPEEVQRLVRYCGSKRIPLIVGCDSNAHNTEWGSKDTNKRGEYLLEFLLSENLTCYNRGNTPTFVTRVREEVLDITLGSTSLNDMVQGWRVSSEPSMSDHRIIEFTLEGIGRDNHPYRNPKKTNWDLYTNSLKVNLELASVHRGAKHPLELEQAVEEFNSAVTRAYESSCPLRISRERKDVPWWGKELSKRRAEVRKLFNHAKRTGNWQTYQETLTMYNKELRKAKRDSFILLH